MTPLLERNKPCMNQQDLINQYEDLRTFALKKVSVSSNNPLGFSILLFRGMAIWAETLSSEFGHTCQEAPSYFQVQKSNTIEQYSLTKHYGLLHPICKEATIILTNMVMYQQKETKKEEISHA